MKKLFTTLLLIIFVFRLTSQNVTMEHQDSYHDDWEKVAQYEEQSLPRSAAEAVNQILRRAIEEKNSPQLIKALIHQGKYELALDEQNNTFLFHQLQEMINVSNDVVEQSVLHSILGELYLDYYQANRWDINERIELGDYVPTDMKEWTRNIFFQKALEELNASIENESILVNVDVSTYSAVVELGKDSRHYFPSMFDFLAKRAIELYDMFDKNDNITSDLARKNISLTSLYAPAEEFVALTFDPQPTEYFLWSLETYRKFIASLLEREMHASVLLTELELLDFLSEVHPNHEKYALKSLQRMLEKWNGNEISVEVIDKIAALYQSEIWEIPSTDNLQLQQKTGELYDFLQQYIDRYSTYPRLPILKSRLLQLTHSQLAISGKKTFPVKGDKKLNVTFQNIKSLGAKLYKIEDAKDVVMAQYGIDKTLEQKRTFLKDIPITLPELPEYLQGETTIQLNLETPGIYMLTFHTSPETLIENSTVYYFSVSDLAVFSRSSSKDQYDFFVINRESGAPVKNAAITILALPGNWRNSTLAEIDTVVANKEGMAIYHKNTTINNLYFQAVAGNDKGSLLSPLPGANYVYANNDTTTREEMMIFTDRSLYRPGQTLFYKAILTRTLGNVSSIVPNKSVEFVLLDSNGEEIAKQTAITNDYGSVSGEFSLPQGILPGNFSIASDEGSAYFQVVEYKRPTFEVTFEKIDQTYKFEEEIQLKGSVKNFSGISLQQTTVEWRITRQQAWWWRWGARQELFSEGQTTTDNEGSFAINFTPSKPENQHSIKTAYSFKVEIVVTDLNGETQIGNYTVTVGDISMNLEIDIPERLEKESNEEIHISAKNLDGAEVPATGSYQLFSLLPNDSINKGVLHGDFIVGAQTDLQKQLSRLPSGKYRLTLQSYDDRKNRIEASKDFLLFSYADKRPPIQTDKWLIIKNKTFSPSKNGEVILGATSQIHVLYELWNGNSLLERKWIRIKNQNHHFSIPYQDKYKEGVTLMLTYVKDERFYTHRVDMIPEKEEKELHVKLDVFRDKVRPGTKEEWRISVRDANGNPSVAEVLASMYDFSLDKIHPSDSWGINLNNSNSYSSRMGLNRDQSFNSDQVFGLFIFPQNKIDPFVFDRFNWYGFSLNSNVIWIRGASSVDEVVMVGYSKAKLQQESVTSEAMSNELGESVELLSVNNIPEELPAIRRNFAETAFFYPHLTTNEQGETQIAFTVPESNTRWRFRVLAHDKNLQSGQLEAFTVSQKELMVTPNMPRFLRHGDKTSITTKISNLSEETQHGNVMLEFFNPTTDEVIDQIALSDQTKEFTLVKGASSSATWMFDVPSGIDILGVRIVAQTANFSDGEQHALVVLPNKMLVTESIRLDVNGNQTNTFTMDRLLRKTSSTARDYRLTLEFSNNPAWYAIQALPVLGEPTSENTVSWFASYYANTLGAHIGKTYPRISAMIELWKKQGGNKETFLSNLEKNSELKNVLLEETPWLLSANNEAEQKAKLALLFDLNRSSYLSQNALSKLQELQTSQGGWSWFKGFNPSVAITHYVLFGFSQLKELGISQDGEAATSMISKAVEFMDAEAIRRFNNLKEWNKDWAKTKSISIVDLEYLFVRSAYPQYSEDEQVKELTTFYRSVLEKNWTSFGLYERALIAIFLQRVGKEDIVQKIVNSYRQHATISKEMGMYWPNNKAHVFMSLSAISVHTFIMDAFRASGAHADEMDQMKRWLLKQKQTQMWESTHATTDAVYALLSTGSDWFQSQGETRITVGNHLVESDKLELGTGYIKESWSEGAILPKMGKVTVVHQGDSPAWGALYRQYYEELDKIAQTDASLNVDKQLFVEQTDASGTRLMRITDENPLTVGDKIVVRLTVRSDRDLEFVHLKDMRAAAFEPVSQLSSINWQNGLVYYQTSKDASTNFYFNLLPRGTYIFEYAVYVSRSGSYANGITTIQCMYAPEFSSHTAGIRIFVK
jgi:uncharacterized protein YfaS (alpha-2-macroglobulin family)